MKLSSDYIPYLDGRKLNVGLRLVVSQDHEPALTRLEYVEQKIQGKHVLHVGCTDHAQLIEERIHTNNWAHKRLTEVAVECLGIDIDEVGIATAARFGFENIINCDLTKDDPHPRILQRQWDYAIFGEVLEHIDNPVFFLNTFLIKYGTTFDRIIVTVPNAFHLKNFRHALRHQERINTDHRYWFTPYTLAKVVTMAGFDIADYSLCRQEKKAGRFRRYRQCLSLRAMLMRKYPLLRPTIVMEIVPTARSASR